MDKKAWLDYLYYDLGKQMYDFYLQYSNYNGIKTKWKKFSEAIFPIDFDGYCSDWKKKKFFEQCNQRQILPFEVVLDLEDKETINKIAKELKSEEYNFYIFDTGSRGYHVHIFFNRNLTYEEKLDVITYFGADKQKAVEKTLIALEFATHWKSGKVKNEVILK